ncbi:MAG: 3-deoxy-manno-octulosonate cytidylyltransferase, partial [Granulosicoccus sp.]
PARYASNRFPGKPLHLINAQPMILHTAMRAQESNASLIVVATDDERIRRVCDEAGIEVEMTDANHPSGTDRIAEVAVKRGWSEETVIVGLQGDEPATPAHHLDLLASNLMRHADAEMATLCMPIASSEDYNNTNRVKVVRDHRDMALYFSRAAIPTRRRDSQNNPAETDSFPQAFLHIGIYAYRCGYLSRYTSLPHCELEREEQLEQLRVLYHGGRIHAGQVELSDSRGVDHPDDVPVLEKILAEHFSKPGDFQTGS